MSGHSTFVLRQTMNDSARRLCQLALDSPTRAVWRQAALGELSEHVRFEAALFHELSPRVSLQHAGSIAIDLQTVEKTRGQWDQNAVELGRLQIRALAQDGVATDREAFGSNRRAQHAWKRRVLGPLRLSSVLAAHLVVDDRIIAVLILGRRVLPAFSSAEREAFAPLVPILTICDALHLSRSTRPIRGASTTVRCVDQRLTPRQREVVEQVALGRTNAEIGVALSVSPHTVRNLLVEIRGRLGASNRAELMRLAVMR